MSNNKHQSTLIALAITLILTLCLILIIKPERPQGKSTRNEVQQSHIQIFNPKINLELTQQAKDFELDDPSIILDTGSHNFRVNNELEITLPSPKIELRSDSLQTIKTTVARAQTYTPRVSPIDSTITKNWPKTSIVPTKPNLAKIKNQSVYFITTSPHSLGEFSFSEDEIKLIKNSTKKKNISFIITYRNKQFSITPQQVSTTLKKCTLILRKKLLHKTREANILGQTVEDQHFTLKLELN